MSDPEIPAPGSKKRRLQGACDICRSKKIRCDSGKMPNNICSNCIAFNSSCTHLASAANRRNPKEQSQATGVHRAAVHTAIQSQIEAILSETTPYSLPKEPSSVLRTLVDIATYARNLERELAVLKGTALPDLQILDQDTYTRPPTPMDLSLTATEGCVFTELRERMKGLMVDSSHNRFYGQSSDIMLIKTVMDIKQVQVTGRLDKQLADHLLAIKRPEYWNSYPFHQPPEEAPDIYVFPEPDLMDSLLSLYWLHVQPFVPLLHRPTFEKSVAEGLHLKNSRFGATLLLVCAMAARYSSDPRVYLNNSEHSCGWKWAAQIRLVRQSFTTTPSLYDVQICCLAVIFLQSTGCPELCWVLTSIGIRLAQDVGAHRRRRYTGSKPAEDQLWTRAFWVLVLIDILISASFGRPRATTADDFDLDLPIECDDIYWENSDPEKAFKQPSGIPSVLAYLTCYIKLLDILGFAQKTLYTLKRSKKRGAEAEQWNQQVVAELDSAMNNWIDSLPDHLRWDPHREDSTFSQQSASLYVSYYHIQIQIHRPFLPRPGHSSPLSYPSLAVCANSARACAHIMDVQSRRGILPLAHVMMGLFDSSVILLLIIWSGKQSGMTIDASKELRDVHACLKVLQSFEQRWQVAGRLWDILYAMLTASDSMPSSPPPPSTKRDRDSDTRRSSPSTTSTSGSEFSSLHPPDIVRAPLNPLEEPLLPVHSAELGRLPATTHHFEIANPFGPTGALGSLVPGDVANSQAIHGWSNAFSEFQDGVKILPSDFFTSMDNTFDGDLGAAWVYPPEPTPTMNWNDWIDVLR
ncbi:fungal-specific transcription factor domain-containing protein [Mycena maculata]|uniref:Fungal-specific transcription factor domain-containing protein n=1 Tax=Mycena maculata TaxID=230809 RepID=A0AAD7NRU2_9AGAR|nr:fungal-specific transcription factor domain-containing protein [Mycena maculata]